MLITARQSLLFQRGSLRHDVFALVRKASSEPEKTRVDNRVIILFGLERLFPLLILLAADEILKLGVLEHLWI